MRLQKKYWLPLAILLVATVCIWLVMLANREPMYAGKTYSEWFHESEQAPYVIEDAPRTKAIRALGEKIVPELGARVRQGDPWWVAEYWTRYHKLPRRIQHFLPAPERPEVSQCTAAMLLYEVGLASRAAVPEMIAGYDDAYRRQYLLPGNAVLNWSAQLDLPPPVLPSAPRGVVPGLPLGIPTPDEYVRQWVVLTLVNFGGENKEVAPLLLAAIRDPDVIFRNSILQALKKTTNLASAVELAQPAVTTAVTNSMREVRAAAVAMLGLLPANPGEVVPVLVKAAEDPDPLVRENALVALTKRQVDFTAFLPLASRLYDDPDVEVCHLAARVLVLSSGGVTKFLPALNEALGSANPAVRAASARVMRGFGARAKPAIPKLRELASAEREADEQVRHEALETLKKVDPTEFPP